MAYSSNDYSDIFCQAVSNIVKSEVAKLEFDVSGEYTVIKINDKKYGKYQLSDGSIDFEAIAGEGDSYEVGDQVIATIPKGDYNKQISILTKVNSEWDTPAGFVRPLDTMTKCISFTGQPANLIANGSVVTKRVLTLNNPNFFGFKKIGVSAKFKSLLENFSLISGSYGLKFTLEMSQGDILQFLFSSDEMLGNPYAFTTFFEQQYVFNIPDEFENVTSLTIDFYQDGNFVDGNGNELTTNEKFIPIPNLYIENMEVYFGYDSEQTVQELVKITCPNLTFKRNTENIETNEKTIELNWFHKVDIDTMEQITANKCNQEDDLFVVQWYRYTPGVEENKTDEHGKENWEKLEVNDPLCLTINMRGSRQTERIKARCQTKTTPLQNDDTYIVYNQYWSNELVFENTDEETDGGELSESIMKEFSLSFIDNSDGNYYSYDQNGDLIDRNEGVEKTREIVLKYKGAEINEDNPVNITRIKWDYPVSYDISEGADGTQTKVPKASTESMIIIDPTQHIDDDKPYKLEYSIFNRLEARRSNNTVQCAIEVDEQLYTVLTETFQFGKQGSNGTTTTFILEMLEDKNALVIGDKLSIQAKLLRNTGKQIYFSNEEKEKITWKLINNNLAGNSNNELIIIDGGEDNNTKTGEDIITLSLNTETIPDNNYTILKASYQYTGDTPVLETYLPIPIRHQGWQYIEGATQVLYSHQGVPKYDNGIYVAYQFQIDNSERIESRNWNITTADENPNQFSLKKSTILDQGVGLSAAALYSKYSNSELNVLKANGINIDPVLQDKVCVYCKGVNENNEEIILWSQPVLVMQSQYDYAMLNSWDGSLTIDDKNGTILSTMLGAGRKDSQNKFSGVLIGDVKKGTNNEDAPSKTGVYGFDKGTMTYGLEEDGKAFLGAYDNGRIEIDGTSGVIKSTGWTIEKNNDNTYTYTLQDGKEKGSIWNLTNGDFILQKKEEAEYFKFVDNSLSIKSNTFDLSATNIEIHSNPVDGGNYFKVGDNTNYMSLSGDGKLDLSATKVEIHSNPAENGNYFKVGDDDNYMSFSEDGVLTVKGHIDATSLTISQEAIESAGLMTSAGITTIIGNTVTTGFINALGGINASSITIKEAPPSDGTIFSASGNSVSMAGWEVHSNYIVNYGEGANWNSFDKNGSFLLMSEGTSPKMKFANSDYKTDWRLAIGQYFGVDSSGSVYCSDLKATNGSFTGTIGSGTVMGGNGLLKIDVWDTSGNARIVTKNINAGITFNNSTGALVIFCNNLQIGHAAGGTTRMVINNGYGGFQGNWSFTASSSTESDENLKNSIEPLTEKYSLLFDKLIPVRYKYNNGTSNRYHTGIIAQNLQQAILDAGLSEQEVAALCTMGNSYMSIRYEELVSLCINEIQYLKNKINTLK